jgi:hypothetical protein
VQKTPEEIFDELLAEAGIDPKQQNAKKPHGANGPTGAEPPPPEPLVYVDISKWIGAPVPKREWEVLNRIPARNVTVLSGTGGIGKTIVAMMLAAAIVLGFGTVPELGPVMFLSGEEPEDEMHRRFADIVDYLNAIYRSVTYQDLIKGGLHLIDKAGKDAMLAVPDRNGRMETTPLFKQLLAEACRIKPRLVILDNRNKVYGGNINDPTQVSEFITMLHGFAIDANTAVLLILHPSVAGIAANKDSPHQGLAGDEAFHKVGGVDRLAQVAAERLTSEPPRPNAGHPVRDQSKPDPDAEYEARKRELSEAWKAQPKPPMARPNGRDPQSLGMNWRGGA